MSPYFCTNNEKMSIEMNSPYILLVDKKISNIHDLLPILQITASSGKELLIIAEDIEGDALATLVVNKLKGILRVAAVKAPGFGDKRKAMMQDIATLTGATLVTEDAGITLKEATVALLGSAQKVTITKDHTTIIHGSGLKQQIEKRLKQIENEIANSTSSYDKEKLEERRAKLSGGVAVIRVGAATEPELKNKKQAFEDSLNSTKAAIEEGVVPGGGVALLRASAVISSLTLEGDELLGAKLFMHACQAPLRQIAVNAGKDGSVIMSQVIHQKESFGFNALTEQVEDMLKAGVIDPAKVVKHALLFAASAAGIVLISECLIADIKEEA
jgi:chaperonin GroEL